MSTGTATVAFIAGLVTRLAARPGLIGVQVVDSYPETGMKNESIWAEDAESDNEIPLMKSGTKKVDEVVTTDWVVQVLKPDGSTQKVTDERAAVVLGEFQQELAEVPQTIDAIMWAELASWRMKRGKLGNGGHGTRFEISVRHQARLYP